MNLNGGFPIIYSDNPWAYDNPQNFDPARGGTPYKQLSIDDLCDMGPLVQSVAAKDCACFMWATLPKLPEALRCMDAWGFNFTAVPFVWLKLNPTGSVWQPKEKCSVLDEVGELVTTLDPKDIILDGGIVSGLGHWTAGNVEFVLFGKKGKPKRVSKSIKQVVFAPVIEMPWCEVPLSGPQGPEMPTEIVVAPRLRPHSAKPPVVADRIKELMGDIPGVELFARPPKRKGWLKLGFEMNGLDIQESLTRLTK